MCAHTRSRELGVFLISCHGVKWIITPRRREREIYSGLRRRQFKMSSRLINGMGHYWLDPRWLWLIFHTSLSAICIRLATITFSAWIWCDIAYTHPRYMPHLNRVLYMVNKSELKSWVTSRGHSLRDRPPVRAWNIIKRPISDFWIHPGQESNPSTCGRGANFCTW